MHEHNFYIYFCCSSQYRSILKQVVFPTNKTYAHINVITVSRYITITLSSS